MSIATDIIERIESNTKEISTYEITNTWVDGSVIDDSKCDGVIFRKKSGIYYKLAFSGSINVKWFGAKGDGVTDDSQAFIRAINVLKDYRIFLYQKNKTVRLELSLFIPQGNYNLTQKITIPSGITLKGEGANSSVIITRNRTINLFEISDADAIAGSDNTIYTEIKDLSIFGYHCDRNPFEAKATPNASNIGIKIIRSKVRIINCNIAGWEGDGINMQSVYYVHVINSIIYHNRIGINVNTTSTSLYLSNSEIRLNSIGLYGDTNSYACYVNLTTIESNIANFLPQPSPSTLPIYSTRAVGVLLRNCKGWFFNNCYIENQTWNFCYYDSRDNIVEDCEIVPGPTYNNPNPIVGRIIQFVETTTGTCIGNKFINNKYMGASPALYTVVGGSSTNIFEINTEEDLAGFISANPSADCIFLLESRRKAYTKGVTHRTDQPRSYASGSEPTASSSGGLSIFDMIFDTTNRVYKYWDGSKWIVYNREALRSGTTVNRPVSFIEIGQIYYDTTVGDFVMWNGTTWQAAVLPATTSKLGTVLKSATQANSTATDINTLVTDFNSLLTKLKAAGIMAS